MKTLIRCGVLGLSCVVAVSTAVERIPRIPTMRGAPARLERWPTQPKLLPRDLHDDVAHEVADTALVTALSELERQTHDVQSASLRALFVDRARALFTLAADVQLMRGRHAAALWFSDRARQVALRTFSSLPDDTHDDAERLGSELIKRVPPGIAVVHQELRGEKLLSWIVRDGELHFMSKAFSEDVVAVSIERFRTNHANLHDAQRLYEALLRPIDQYTTGSKLVVYSPSPALYGVPFAALHDGRAFVIERHAIAVTPSIRTFVDAVLEPAAGGTGLALIALPPVAPGARSLPGARDEVRAIAEIYAERATSLQGVGVSAKLFLEMLSRFDVIHVSSHGLTASTALENAVEFGPDRVCAKEIVQLRLARRPVVVLASCRTSEETGNATLGLSTSFVAAGASAVIGSLWDIEDQTTTLVMKEFHRSLSRGVAAAEAMSLAQRSAIARGERLGAWAAFQVQM